MSERIIEVKDLEYSYHGFKAVDGVCFFVREGEIFSADHVPGGETHI